MFLAGMGAGCAGGESASSFTVQDSSGVRIATNTGTWDLGDGPISVADEPTVSIGTVSGDSLYQFSRIRGGVRLSDGRLAIMDGGSHQLRIYSADGVFEQAWGREGAGPGEFRSPTLAGRAGDTLIVLDSNNRRLARYLADEGLVDEVPIDDQAGGALQSRGVFSNGTLASGGGFYFSSASGESLSSGLRRPPTAFGLIGRNGQPVADVGEFPGLEMYFEVSGNSMSARLIPFGRGSVATVSDERLYIGTGDTPELQAFGPSGGHVGTLRWEQPPQPVSGADLDAYQGDALQNADDADERRRIRKLVSDHPAEFHPALVGLVGDRLGNLWVEESTSPAEERLRYRVFDSEGRLFGRVALPAHVRVLEIGEDYVLARHFDEFEVEYVQLYDLVRVL